MKTLAGYTTENGVSIDLFIENGSTLIANNEKQANIIAKENNSYIYQVFQNGKSCGLYAIPK